MKRQIADAITQVTSSSGESTKISNITESPEKLSSSGTSVQCNNYYVFTNSNVNGAVFTYHDGTNNNEKLREPDQKITKREEEKLVLRLSKK